MACGVWKWNVQVECVCVCGMCMWYVLCMFGFETVSIFEASNIRGWGQQRLFIRFQEVRLFEGLFPIVSVMEK